MTIWAAIFFLLCSPTALLDFAIPKWKADKNVRIEDAYKWTYQATRGGEHAVPDEESAREWLDGEWSGLGKPITNKPVWELLCPGGEIGRLNLREFKASGGKADDLLAAFLASSRKYRFEQSSFVTAWLELGKQLKKKPAGKINHKEWSRLDAEMKAKNYPAIHHSETYERGHHPAYRILTKIEMQKLLRKVK